MKLPTTRKEINSNKLMQIYPTYTEAGFVRRLNRFVMELTLNGEPVKAYVPNTGRMSEFLVYGHPFYLVNTSRGKYQYKVVATQYQGQFVFLDTGKINDIFHELLRQNYLNSIFGTIRSIRREFSILNSRFDFRLDTGAGATALVEIKSCTLIHNTVAMFPDAPTLRGQKHIRELQQLADDRRSCHVVYLIMNGSADRFFPNFHTDYEYGLEFLRASGVNFHALRLKLSDPVTIDLSSVQAIPVDTHTKPRQINLHLWTN